MTSLEEKCISERAICLANDLEFYLTGVRAENLEAIVDAIMGAKRVFVGGAGRSFLSMKMFAMRLMQLGKQTYLVGEVCTPALGKGDIFLVASCSATTEITQMLMRKAKSAEARVIFFSARRAGELSCFDDLILFPDPEGVKKRHRTDHLTIRGEGYSAKGLFEAALLIFTDAIIDFIKDRYQISYFDMHKNNENLE